MGYEELKNSPRPHILMVALAAFGHHFQFQQLLHVCKGHEGVIVTFVSSHGRCSELAKMQANGEFQGVDLHLEPLFARPPLYLQDPKFPYRAALIAEQCKMEFQPLAKKVITLKENGLPGVPTCVMSDQFLSFAEDLASQLEVPWYSVFVASPPYSSLCLGAPTLFKENLYPYDSPRRNEASPIPGTTFANVRDIPHENVDFPDFWLDLADRMSRATGLVYNSAAELDAPAGALEAIKKETELRVRAANRKGPKIFAIGPILNFPGFTGTSTGTGTGESSSKEGASSASLEFLHSHPASSVLYISFGSASNISIESMTELAHGLEASGVPFLWALKLNGSLAGAALPPGFEERTKGRGYVELGWAPQASILSHSSTGGFLSHCGWNSILESLCGGVPLITWPVSADQALNARFVENVARSGVSVMQKFTPGHERFLQPSRHDVESSVRLLMAGEEGKALRKNAKECQIVLTAAVAEEGSSCRALKELMGDILLTPQGKV